MTDFRYKGEDAYPLIDEWIEKKAEEYWRTWDGNPMDVQMSPAAVSLYKMFGLFPIGDTARFGGAWWHNVDLETKKRWFNKYGGFDSEIGWDRYLKVKRKRLDKMFQLYKDHSASVSSEFPPSMSGEQHIPIIDAIVNDREGKFQVNVPNQGSPPGFSNDIVVEVPAIVSGRGVQPIHVEPLPKFLTTFILMTDVLRAELLLEALLKGNRIILLSWILSDQQTRSLEQAEAVLDDLLALPFNKDLLVKFKGEKLSALTIS